MVKLIIDTFAWIEYLNGSSRGKNVATILEDGDAEVFTPSTVVSEIISKFLRTNKEPKIAINAINILSKVVSIDQELGILAGKIHYDTKKKNKDFGMLDAFVVASARKIDAKILTGDKDFKPFKEAIFI